MRSVLVTGGTGPLGRHVAELLRAEGDRVATPGRADLDIRDRTVVERAVAELEPELVIHLAGVRKGPAEEIVATNVAGFEHLASTLGDDTVVIVAGSSAQYGLRRSLDPLAETDELLPTTPYGSSKAAQEALALAARNLRVTAVRLFNLIGAGQARGLLAADIAAQLRDPAAEQVVVGDLSGTRDFVDYADAARALVSLGARAGRGEIYNVCSGRPVALRELASRLIEASGRGLPLVEQPRQRFDDLLHQVGDCSKLTALGWKPAIQLDESVRALLA